ncbi:hypothetical protein N7470_007470 [Penicillium chermesinum]|nr:hypothetical protein N7470_007470 [Penicillium chermesinum]
MENPGYQASAACESERERLRELSRYYCTLHNPQSAEASSETQDHEQDNAPTEDAPSILSKDITLTALAQLGAHQLDCRRSFVSIIDGANQHIIAEATKSISLRDRDRHAPNDAIYLGARSIDLVWGVCAFLMPLFTGQDLSYCQDTPNLTANQTRYIVRDFTKEECYKDRPYVRDWPYFRFYAEVPLFSPSGQVLGSYCVVDDKPRENFSEENYVVLREITDAIANHLENVRIAYFHQRAERWVKGLTTFVKDGKDFNPHEVTSYSRLRSASKLGISRQSTATPPRLLQLTSEKHERKHSADVTRSETSSVPTQPTSIESSSDTHSVTPGIEKTLEEASRLGNATDAATTNAFQDAWAETMPMSERMNMIFTRASVLLQESLDLDGVTFLDASQNPMPVSFTSSNFDGSNPNPATVTPEFPTAPCPSPLVLSNAVPNPLDSPCQVLGSASRPSEPQANAPHGDLTVPRGLLDLLVTLFPQGHVFNLSGLFDPVDYVSEGNGNVKSSSDPKSMQRAIREISRLIPEAKSVLFFPLWDYTKSRWMAGTLSWTKNSRRIMGVEELHYFKVFGNSVVSEISRAHWASVEKSKFDFISSVSHELRSPLHGILASAELLTGTPLQPAQKEMVRMIESSGLTLLDTTDHLLDFCKINSLAKAKTSKQNFTRYDTPTIVSGFDLGLLVEEVTNILYTGQRAPVTSARMVNRIPTNTPPSIAPTSESEEFSVIVRIEQNHPWEIQSQPGAWRRIVMNLLGNAIKWTTAGFVEVSLSHSRNQADPQKLLAHLTVTDTGCGIAPEFLRHKLFTPFTQEDSLDEGVGLGLSIVNQLVGSLGGHINVQSELDVGTQVDVHIPVQYLHRSTSQSTRRSSLRPLVVAPPPFHACLVAFNGYPDLKEPPTGMLTVEERRKLSIQSTLADVLLAQAGWSVSLVDSLDKANGDVVVIEEGALKEFIDATGSVEQVIPKLPVKAFIVLGSKVSSLEGPDKSKFFWVTQPFGPRKILNKVHEIIKISHENPNSKPEPAPELREAEAAHDTEFSPEPVPDVEKEEIEEEPKVLEPPSELQVPATIPSPTSPSKPEAWHVLVVDDNNINLKIMATFMRKMGCTYDTASNGLIALEKYIGTSKAYNLVLMDISMPVMDGLESTSKIRQHEKETGMVPACIMAVTGVASDSMQQQAQAAGINDYLIKPLSLQELKKMMNIA